MRRFEFGEVVEDMITGFEGTVTARVQYSHAREDEYKVEKMDSLRGHAEAWIPESRLTEYIAEEDEDDDI